MVAPAPHNEEPVTGSFGQPIRRTIGSTWTEDELRGLKRRARFRSVATVIRQLIGAERLAELAEIGRRPFDAN